jgi:hypothetical protein
MLVAKYVKIFSRTGTHPFIWQAMRGTNIGCEKRLRNLEPTESHSPHSRAISWLAICLAVHVAEHFSPANGLWQFAKSAFWGTIYGKLFP